MEKIHITCRNKIEERSKCLIRSKSGKSTLIDSIITTFYNKHKSKSKKIQSLTPWGTSLDPRPIIIFKNNGKEYKIIKNFKNNCLLEESIAGKWRGKAEGDRADKKLLEIVGGKFALATGKERPDYWGLGQNLWMIQGKPIISDKLNEDTLSALQTMIGATMGSEKDKNGLSCFVDN